MKTLILFVWVIMGSWTGEIQAAPVDSDISEVNIVQIGLMLPKDRKLGTCSFEIEEVFSDRAKKNVAGGVIRVTDSLTGEKATFGFMGTADFRKGNVTVNGQKGAADFSSIEVKAAHYNFLAFNVDNKTRKIIGARSMHHRDHSSAIYNLSCGVVDAATLLASKKAKPGQGAAQPVRPATAPGN